MRFFLRLPEWMAKAAQRGWVRPGHKYIRRWWDAQANRWRYEYYEAKEPDDHKGADAYVHVTPSGRIAVATEYDPKLKDQLKALGGKWDPDTKSWTYDPKTYLEKVRPLLKHVVYHPEALAALEEHLPEEEKAEATSIQKQPGKQLVIAREQLNLPGLSGLPEDDYKPGLVEFLAKQGIGVQELKPGATYRWQWSDGDSATLTVPGTGGRLTLEYYSKKDDLNHHLAFDVNPDGQLELTRYGFKGADMDKYEFFRGIGSAEKKTASKVTRALFQKPATEPVVEGVTIAPQTAKILPPEQQGSPNGALLLEVLSKYGIKPEHLQPGRVYTLSFADHPPVQVHVEGEKDRPERIIVTTPVPSRPGTTGSIVFGVNRGHVALQQWALGQRPFEDLLHPDLKAALTHLLDLEPDSVEQEPQKGPEKPTSSTPIDDGAGEQRTSRQPPLLEEEGPPLFPEVRPEPVRRKAKQKKQPAPPTNKTRRDPGVQPKLLEVPPVQPGLLDAGLPELAKALGYRPGMALLIKAEERTIPVKRLKWVDRPRERQAVPASHFLLPEERKFPYRNKDGSINCALLRAAISRAAQHGYREVEEKARRLYLKHCKKKQG